MLPNPMHPAVVHFPIVLALLLPVVLAGVWVAIGRGATAARTWGIVVALFAVLFLASWVSVKTGEAQEEVVEEVLRTDRPLHDHEEAAERFLILAGIALALAPVGMIKGRIGSAGRAATAVASLVLVAAVYNVGHSGGELVYRHGAASAYATGAGVPVTAQATPEVEREREP